VTTWELVPGLVAAGLGLGAVIAPLADIVLDRVPQQDAGSASGVFNTGLQLGNSIGIAVIGVIFFGIIGSQSGPAASTSRRRCARAVVAAGVPARRRGDSRPSSVLPARPAGRRRPDGHPRIVPAHARPVHPARRAARVLAEAGASAVRHDFAASLVRTLWFQVGAFLLSFLLMFALPRPPGRRRPRTGDGPHQRKWPPRHEPR
jgi:MFS family permease